MLTLGGSAFTSEISGRIPPKPHKTGFTSDLGSLQVQENDFPLFKTGFKIFFPVVDYAK